MASVSEPKNGRLTRRLLIAGSLVAPVFMGLSLIQAFTRPGFDLTRHEVSLLLVGQFGWIQAANFILVGLLGVACAVGVRQALHQGKGGTWGPILISAYGVLLIIAGLFHPDPQLGFPVEAPQGLPASPSTHDIVHSMAFSLLGLAIVAASLVFSFKFMAEGRRTWAMYGAINAITIVGLVAVGSALMPSGHGGLPMLAVATAISGWVSLIALQMLRRERAQQ